MWDCNGCDATCYTQCYGTCMDCCFLRCGGCDGSCAAECTGTSVSGTAKTENDDKNKEEDKNGE